MFDKLDKLNKYKNILGLPNEGIHKHFGTGFAVIDVIMTLILAIIFIYVMRYKFTLSNVLIWFLIFFTLGQILHLIFGVNTAFVKLLKRYI